MTLPLAIMSGASVDGDAHPDFHACARCGDMRYLHKVDPWPGECEFEPTYLLLFASAADRVAATV